MDLGALTRLDVFALLVTAAVAVGGAKLLYAAAAARGAAMVGLETARWIRRAAAVVLMGAAAFLVLEPALGLR